MRRLVVGFNINIRAFGPGFLSCLNQLENQIDIKSNQNQNPIKFQ
jgi:hypothetical protein